ncbi:MFS general substrate transporter [Lentinus tigrinus ALCF2SS1-7]|uniref:MFS general substrate transporter n=1 Tax=Lentinus tigrinus ALCF2SS1-6 TaxID=1328759 RepID=A0A5C2SA01_9APHY|nr:MFS general substrate transporter [Lentinus tigrinus ALCF2SS1-6]RPD75790.1 MFS general substrate transporter [Lentinus tigrinus ALCF2SS1-7]
MSDKGTESRSEGLNEKVAPTIQETPVKGDLAYGGEDTLPPPPTLTAEEEKRLWRKIDMRLMPILTLMYLCSFLDRGNIGNAKLQGLTTQLNLTGDKYNIALTMYFVPYCLFECPANLVLKKFRPSKWLPGITLVWGLIMTLMGLVKNYPQLVGTRICLGVAEAGLFPGVVYYLSLWYPRHMLQYRVGIFFGGATLAGAFSGLLAFGISFMAGTAGLLGWSWIFIIEGMATVVVGAISFFILVDFPHTATFLTPEERAWVVHRKKYDNSSVGEEEHFELRHIWETLLDWQVWAHILIYMSIITPLYGISLFLPSIINGFGFSTAISQLLTVPPYVFATATLLVWAIWSDRIKKRWPFVLAGLVYCLVGFAINISDVPIGAKYFGTFLIVAGAYAGFPGVVAWLGNNLAGHYKRGVGMALHIGIGNFGGAIASNIYRSQDAPRYILGHGLELMFVGIGFIALPLTVLSYKRINARRDVLQKEADETGTKLTPAEIRRLGDRAPDFRYTL